MSTKILEDNVRLEDENNEVRTALANAYAAGRNDMTSDVFHHDGSRDVLVPSGTQLLRSTDPNYLPPWPVQEVSIETEESFIDYVNRYRTDDTRIFSTMGNAHNDNPSFLTVFDYHEPSPTGANAKRCAHVCRYYPEFSEEWKIWGKRQSLKQVEFAEFIEENRRDIQEPSAAELLDIVSNFKASRKQQYDSAVYNANGDIQIGYSEQTEQSGSAKGIAVPEKLRVAVPVFFRGPVYALDIFIRYRVRDGGVVFELKPDRTDVLENDAFTGIMNNVHEKTEIKPYLGLPRLA